MRAIAPNTTLPILNQQEVGSSQVVVPPINEQEEIAAKCHEIWEATKAIVEAQRSSAKKLREYRQTLISAAVTGQLDVRSRTARALDPTALEPLEEVLT